MKLLLSEFPELTGLKKETTTYIPLLLKVLQASSGPVLEVGAGFSSTPLLHWLCAETERPLVTLESNKPYYKYAKLFLSKSHSIRFVEDWEKEKFEGEWSVAFVDHTTRPRKRVDDAIKLVNNTDFLVLHDTEPELTEHYGFHELWPLVKYRYDWTFCKPYTSVVSNKIDVCTTFQ